MDFSIVIANYNYGRYIGRCVRSLLSQSVDLNQYEVIIVDDASTDDSIAVLEAFGQGIRILRNEVNMGLSQTANSGIKSARGRYIVRVDSDDYVHKDFLRNLQLGFEFFGRESEAISTDYLKVTPEGDYLSYGDAQNNPIACAIAFKMDALEHLGYYNDTLRINEEIDLRKRFEQEAFRIRNLNIPLYRYVQHSKSLTNSVII